ncbi:hypothetical protein CC78DRAFT_617277 [Lojkania enalia]|uniref:Uncharacterized protein n=1 Tax=Lojkania enalia TaxID=147567 RepID=A0A9P4N870_9PLEO|nr:hypothetical protein CC78DRAFT_617277 [Didymosphaeria enalia]
MHNYICGRPDHPDGKKWYCKCGIEAVLHVDRQYLHCARQEEPRCEFSLLVKDGERARRDWFEREKTNTKLRARSASYTQNAQFEGNSFNNVGTAVVGQTGEHIGKEEIAGNATKKFKNAKNKTISYTVHHHYPPINSSQTSFERHPDNIDSRRRDHSTSPVPHYTEGYHQAPRPSLPSEDWTQHQPPWHNRYPYIPEPHHSPHSSQHLRSPSPLSRPHLDGWEEQLSLALNDALARELEKERELKERYYRLWRKAVKYDPNGDLRYARLLKTTVRYDPNDHLRYARLLKTTVRYDPNDHLRYARLLKTTVRYDPNDIRFARLWAATVKYDLSKPVGTDERFSDPTPPSSAASISTAATRGSSGPLLPDRRLRHREGLWGVLKRFLCF